MELQWDGVVHAVSLPVSGEALPEESLVQECLEGDGVAWRLLHRRYYPVAGAFLRKLGVRERDLEDACQEVFLQMFRYLPRFRGEAELRTWMYRLCITQARRVRRFDRISDTLRRALSFASEPLVSGPGFSEAQARRRIDEALAALPEGERSVFVLYEMEGMPGKDIAKVVGCPEPTVWRRLHYARRTFREALGLDSTDAR